MKPVAHRRLTAFIALCAISAVIVWPHISDPIGVKSQEEKVSSKIEQDLEIARVTKERNARRETAESWDKWNIRATFFAGLAATCLVITAMGVSRSNGKLAEVSDELNAAKDAQTAESLTGLGVDLATAKGEMSKQEARAAKAEKDLLELQERVKPRHLTAEQKEKLIQSLKNQPRGQLEIRTLVGNPESRNFGLELTEVFRASGWAVTLSDGTLMTPTPVGIKLWVHTDQVVSDGSNVTDEAPDRAVSAVKAFEYAHVAFHTEFNRDIPKGQVVLLVGFKP